MLHSTFTVKHLPARQPRLQSPRLLVRNNANDATRTLLLKAKKLTEQASNFIRKATAVSWYFFFKWMIKVHRRVEEAKPKLDVSTMAWADVMWSGVEVPKQIELIFTQIRDAPTKEIREKLMAEAEGMLVDVVAQRMIQIAKERKLGELDAAEMTTASAGSRALLNRCLRTRGISPRENNQSVTAC